MPLPTDAPRSIPAHQTNPTYPNPNNSQQPSWQSYSMEQDQAPAQTTPRESQPTDNDNDDAKMTVHESIASADITNPSDALEFLANAAAREEGRMLPPIRSSVFSGSPSQQSSTISGQISTPGSSTRQYSAGTLINYAPLQKGQINIELLHELLAR